MFRFNVIAEEKATQLLDDLSWQGIRVTSPSHSPSSSSAFSSIRIFGSVSVKFFE